MKKSFKIRILVSIISIVVIIFVVFSLYVYKEINDAVDAEHDVQDKLITSAIENHIGTILSQTELSVLAIANNEAVQKLFYDRDREGLKEYLLPVYSSISDRVAQFQFHLPDSTSFLRLHKPEKYGDDLSSFRFTVNEANQKKVVVTGIESGVAGYGLRVVIPVTYQDQHLGTVEYGNGFGLSFLSEMKDKLGGDFSIYTFDDSSADKVLLLANTSEEETTVNYSKHIDTLKSGQYSKEITEDENYYVLMIPFKDFSGNINGFITRISDYSRIRNNNTSIRNTLMIIVFGSLIILNASIYIMLVVNLRPLVELNAATMQIAEGDLRVNLEVKNEDELGMIANSFNIMVMKVRDVLSNIHKTSNNVAASADIVSESSSSLSEGAMDQASAIEELTASMTLIADQTKLNAENASRANDMTNKAEVLATDGNQKMKNMIGAMGEINEASNNISKIVKVIDDIAFQTNILALNAAVEAARAGVHGKGFAVVAEEVRNLASKSSQAVRETTVMIESSISKVNVGSKIADETAEGLTMIVEEVSHIKEIVSEIATASVDQSASVEQINMGINQISDVVQRTSGTARETADSSETLLKQANVLKNQVTSFKVE